MLFRQMDTAGGEKPWSQNKYHGIEENRVGKLRVKIPVRSEGHRTWTDIQTILPSTCMKCEAARSQRLKGVSLNSHYKAERSFVSLSLLRQEG